MKHRLALPHLAFLLLCTVAVTPLMLGQPSTRSAAATGTLTGRVQNVASGNYLNKARVAVKGTDLVTYTDEFGFYRLVDVPAGNVTLEVFYTDLDVQQIPLAVTSGGSTERNVELTSKARYGDSSGVVKLDSFKVTSDKETDGKAIAINEQRFAPNLKNVMSTDSFGDVLGSNVGEFLKFIPGLTAEYSEVEIVGVSVRGMGSNKTAFTSDGAPLVSANATPTRSFNMNAMALNNVSRIEVTKVPTPSTPADSLAGSVNMVSKSAFERSRRQFNYGLSLVGNHENLTFNKTPHSNGDHPTRKILAGFDFDATLPVNKNFGVVVTGFQSNKYNEQHLATTLFNANAAGTGATFSKPYLQQFTLQDGPRSQMRTTFSLKADWRVTPNSVLSLTGQMNRYKIYIGTLSWAMNAGTVATSSITGGTPFSFTENSTVGATGRGAVNLTGSAQSFEGSTNGTGLSYRFDDGKWKIEAGVNGSTSGRERPNSGHFSSLTSTLTNPVRVSLLDVVLDRPRTISVFDNTNQPVDPYNIANYRVTTAAEAPYNNNSTFRAANLNVRRRFNLFPFPTSLQAGAYQNSLTVDSRQESIAWTYNGPDGNPNTFETPAPYLMQSYRNQDSHYGYSNVPWTSVNRAYTAWKENPVLFTQTPAQSVAQETYRITNSEFIEETVSALYLQGEARLFKNRLNVLTGVRFEKTEDKGEGPLVDPAAVFVRTANGAFARDAAGARIRKTEAGAVGSMQELLLTRKERAYKANRSYDGYYPSLHLTFDVRENLLLRAAYAKTYGRPDFLDIIPNATFAENDLNEQDINNPAIVRGNITVRNTALRPWTADNYDVSLEYYTQQGGVFSAGVFQKEISNFFGTDVRIATAADLQELGLDSRYLGWNVSTKFNAGDASIRGVEFNLRHSLRELGRWGSYFTVFANGTKMELEGNRQADFTSFIPKTGNWGVSFSAKRVTLVAKWNYRGLDKRTAQPAFGPDAFTYFNARTTLDLNAAYQLTRRLSIAASASNVLNVPQELLWYGSSTPAYARQNRTSEFGIALALGLKGSF
ncbi:TonB-dependent receptor [Horticoccus sp. 23ND18S-11]|uniref:TonB-dependent receptor n=1 Tax=Horticoccus sp. 23ND18S-11 TaxID=3391832 RepID=UPI0039C9B0C5